MPLFSYVIAQQLTKPRSDHIINGAVERVHELGGKVTDIRIFVTPGAGGALPGTFAYILYESDRPFDEEL